MPMTSENCVTESPRTYEASAPAASSYTRPQVDTSSTAAKRAVVRAAAWRAAAGAGSAMALVDGRGDDHGEADHDRADHDPDRRVVVLGELPVHVERQEPLHQLVGDDEDDDPDRRVEDASQERLDVQVVHHLPP